MDCIFHSDFTLLNVTMISSYHADKINLSNQDKQLNLPYIQLTHSNTFIHSTLNNYFLFLAHTPILPPYATALYQSENLV